HGAPLAHQPLRLGADLDALSWRQAVRDERRLERDDRLAVAERALDLGRDDDHGIAPSFATHRAAASRASSAPPTRNPAASASPAPVESTTAPGSGAISSSAARNPRAPR